MGTFDALPHGLTLKSLSFTLLVRENGDTMWRGTASLTDKEGVKWLAFAEASNLATCAQYVSMNIDQGELRKKREQ